MQKSPKEDTEKQFKPIQEPLEENGKGGLDGMKFGETSFDVYFKIALWQFHTKLQSAPLLPTSNIRSEIYSVLPIGLHSLH